MIKDAAVKRCLDAAFPRRRHAKWKMTQQQILTDVRTCTLFGMIECDVRVPEELRAFRRDAARVQERQHDPQRSRTIHASIRRRSRYHDASEAHAPG